MPLVDMHDMLRHAYRNGYAIGGFRAASLDYIEAVLVAAENSRSPVILNCNPSAAGHNDLELLLAAAERAARRASVPVALHFDHGGSLEAVRRAINLGCNGVMLDAAQEAFPVNVSRTQAVVEMAHACGVPVEAAIGHVASMEENAADTAQNQFTSVEEARVFVARTGVDCLAVSIGTVHGRQRGKARLDCERLKRIHDAVQRPLVIHGGSGLSDSQYRKLIAHGVAKINYYTALADAAAARLRANARADARGGHAALTTGMQDAIRAEAERVMRLWGSAGRAAEVLVQCRAWNPVAHIIFYNVEDADDRRVEALMAQGREVLAAIPGVRRVFTGWAVADKPRYRFCWLVEFAHPKVIESYRDHPTHAAFANQWFRPIAGDRISIDFAEAAPNLPDAAALAAARA